MASITTYHVLPADGGWAVEGDQPAAPHPTRSLALARALELAEGHATAEVLVHDADGRVRSSLTLRQVDGPDEAGESGLRAEALQVTPGHDRLRAMAARDASAEGADLDADPAELF